jgi:hypothetical protein
MKQIITAIATLTAITGLNMAGAEDPTTTTQIIINLAGLALFAAGGLTVLLANRKPEINNI